MRNLNLYGWLALMAVIVGGIAMGFLGLFNFQILTALFGNVVGRLLYIAIGISGGYLAYSLYLEKFKKA